MQALAASRGRKARAAVLVLLTAIFVTAATRAQANHADPHLQAISSRLATFSQAASTFDSVVGLADALPLSNATIGDKLELAPTFEAVEAKFASATATNLHDTSAFVDFLEDEVSGSYGGVVVDISGPAEGDADAPQVVVRPAGENLIDVVIEISLTAANVNVPLSHQSDLVTLDGGAASGGAGDFPVTFALRTTPLHFQLDTAKLASPDAGVQAEAFALRTVPEETFAPGQPAPAITVTATATNADLGDFSTTLGFADVAVNGTANVNLGARLILNDPDAVDGSSDDRISADEWATADLATLVTPSWIDASGNDFEAVITLTSDLIDTTLDPHDASLTFTLPAAGGSLAAPVLAPNENLGDLVDFRNFTAEDALSALNRLGGFLQGVQDTGTFDLQLPFVEGNFSDVLPLGQGVVNAANALVTVNNPSTPEDESGRPKFATFAGLLQLLGTQLGSNTVSGGAYDATTKRLTFDLDFGSSASERIPMDFGTVDVLAGITLDAAGDDAFLDAAYDLDLTVGFDLSEEPTEGPDAGIGSCADGVDNNNGGGLDAVDPECANSRTLEQRMFLVVGDGSGNDDEITARASFVADAFDATARLGLLQAGIEGASLKIGAGATEDGGDPGSCFDGADNGDDDGADALDDECKLITIDLSRPGADDSGVLTLEELYNTIGATADAPSDAAVDATFDAAVDGALPVAARLAPDADPLAEATVTITADESGPFDATAIVDPENLDINASALRTSELFEFSPCGNGQDDDGDGTADDGCPDAGAPAAVDDPETVSFGLLDKIVLLARGAAAQLRAMQGHSETSGSDTISLDTPLPLVGRSFNDLVDLAEALDEMANDLSMLGEAQSDVPGACTNDDDDDHDGFVNDGCPTSGTNPESAEECAPGNDTDSAAANDTDTVVNDGCPAMAPTLQSIGDQLSALVNDALSDLATQAGIGSVTPTATFPLSYDATSNEIRFAGEIGATLDRSVPLDVNLDDVLSGKHLAFGADGSLDIDITADLQATFGVDLDDLRPFLLGNPTAEVDAVAAVTNLVTEAGLGPVELGIGTNTAVAESACDNDTDDDKDGVVNDGCEGGPAAAADKGRVHLGATFTIEGTGTSSARHYFDEAPFTEFDANLDGITQSPCQNVGSNSAKDACAILPLYLNGTAVGDAATGAHHLEVTLADITSPSGLNVAYNGDLEDLSNLITQQLLDLALAKSGLAELLAQVKALLSGELLGFELPLVGDQLDDIVGFLDKLTSTQGLVGIVNGQSDPLNDAMTAEQASTAIQDSFATPIGNSLVTAGILQDTNGDGSVNGQDVTVALICDDNQPCDFGGEDEPTSANPANTFASGDTNNCDDNADNDGDGVANDGCDSKPNPETICAPATEDYDADDDSDGVPNDGCPGGPPAAEETPGADRETTCTGSGLLADDDLDGMANDGCDEVVDQVGDIDEVRFRIKLGQTANKSAPIDSAVGLPGMGLSIDGTLAAAVNWEANLEFGVNRDGFFLATNPTDAAGATVPELRFGANVTLPGATMEGTLGFLKINVVNGQPTTTCSSTVTEPCRHADDPVSAEQTNVNAQFSVDIEAPGGDDRFTMNEIVSGFDFDDVFSYDLTANAQVRLHTETAIAGMGATMPRLFADVELDWRWAISGEDDPNAVEATGFGTPCTTAATTNCFSVRLADVALDAGTFLSSFLQPLFADVQEYLKVLDPAIKAANTPIPGLSELAGEPITLLTLAEAFGGEEDSTELLVALVKLADFINGIQAPPDGNLIIELGSLFDLNGPRLQQGALSPTQARDAFANASQLSAITPLLGRIDQKYPGGMSSGGSITSAGGLSSIGIAFPFLDEPTKLMGLLFGQDVDLITWKSPQLNVGFTYAQKFGPIWAVPPVFLEIGGSLSLVGEIALGYDTQGLREVAFGGAPEDALLHGLFVLDRYDGRDPNILELRGELFANAQVSVLIFSAGAGGKFYTKIGIDVRDPNGDGKTKYQEVAELLRTTGSPLCLFELNGSMGINIYVFAEVDLLLWSERWEKTIADAVLFEFKVVCDPAAFEPPVLASKNDDTNVVTLHLGVNRALRGSKSIQKDQKVEPFTVKKLGNGANADVEVSAFGFTTIIDGPVSEIVADGSSDGTDGKDSVALVDNLIDDVAVPFDIPSDITGSGGDDTFVGGLATDVYNGGEGKDLITLRDGENEAHGGGGDDRIQGGIHTDELHGDGDNDTINGDLGADEIYGGDGHDRLVGGLSTTDTVIQPGDPIGNSVPGAPDLGDEIHGGAGRDTIDGGDGADEIYGDEDKDSINGGPDNDTIEGGEGGEETDCASSGRIGDIIMGGPGADDIDANGGDDLVIGGSATPGATDSGSRTETLDGGAGCDTIIGDNATLEGGAAVPADPANGARDDIDGGDGADVIFGWVGNDSIDGEGGADTVRGGIGNDDIDGGDGDDTIYGEANNDDLVGGDGADTIDGGSGADVLLGDRGSVARGTLTPVTLSDGTGDDNLFGGTENDIAFGQAGNDFLYGQSGDDSLLGNDGNDEAHGGTGVDHIEGNDGADDLFGDSGNDRIFGGSTDSTTEDDGRDEIFGREGDDLIAGDNATLTTVFTATTLSLEAEATIGDGDLIYGEGGDDEIYAGLGVDEVHGGFDDDYIEGNADGDTLNGNAGDDDMIGGTSEAADGDPDNQGGQPDGGDTMNGNEGADVMVGDNGRIVRTGQPSTFLNGAEERDVEVFDLDESDVSTIAGVDTMNGGVSNDQLFGGGDDDVMHGNAGDDYAEGNPGSDDIWGDEGQDDLIGGTSAEAGDDAGGAHPDGSDDIFGGDGDSDRSVPADDADVIAGDNASIRRFAAGDPAEVVTDDLDQTRSGYLNVVRRQVELYDIATTTSSDPTAPGGLPTSGGETIYGEAGPDVIYGQGGIDTLHGNGADDYLEGNAGGDTLFGEEGQDDLIGGTGRTISDDPSSADSGRLDGIDRLYGGNGVLGEAGDDGTDVDDFDVLMGDNATVLRFEVGAEPAWEINSFNDSVRRSTYLYDVGIVGSPAAAGTSDGDFIYGEADPDLGYGQGGADHVEGAGGDDYLEGNAGNDTILGQVGNDDLVGGTGPINGDDPEVGTNGRLDDGETLIQGGPGFDTITGDNGIIRRVLVNGSWVSNTFNAGVSHHRVRLLDVASLDAAAGAGTSGGDIIEGNGHDDVIYGQGGGDTIAGDSPAAAATDDGNDYAEGNEGGDTIRGGRFEDDLIGGTGLLAGDPAGGVHGRLDGDDQIRGEYAEEEGTAEGDGGDFVTGDNAIVERPLTALPEGDWKVNPPNGVVLRDFVLLDIETVESGPADDTVHGNDTIYGNDNDDTIYAQGGNDVAHGNAGDDYVEGNHADDTLFGEGDQDDIIGGNAVPDRLDGNDVIHGGPAADFELGDNGTLVRPVVDDEWTYFVDYNPTTIVRLATRFDVGTGSLGTAGDDTMNGNEGDDYQWGQDGHDTMHGNTENDDMYGELGDDTMFGGEGEDAMVGDRGNIVDTKLANNSKKISFDTKGPGFFKYTGLVAGQLDRRVSLTDDGDGAPYPLMGIDNGGNDRMRGGPGHDSMHGAYGDDLMNGDSGGDWMFGSDGADVMWGGKGSDDPLTPNKRDDDSVSYTDPFQDRYVDYLFGGHGGTQDNEVLAADILDYMPRKPNANGFAGDPVSWFEMTSLDDNDPTNDQFHQGIDWIYGGFDRDVLEGDVGKNGPDFGDRLVDWVGAWNLYTRCNASYGDDGDIRQHSPAMQELMLQMAYGSGAGYDSNEVRTANTGAYRELGLVYANDIQNGNQGPSFPTSPGHYQEFTCGSGGAIVR